MSAPRARRGTNGNGGDVETIREVGAEGGSLALYGRKTSRGWSFSTLRDESTMTEFADNLTDEELVERRGPVSTFERGVELLDRYPWARLYPLRVHPDFWAVVFYEVARRLLRDERTEVHQIGRWFDVCEGERA